MGAFAKGKIFSDDYRTVRLIQDAIEVKRGALTAEVDGGLATAVMSEATKEVGIESECKSSQNGRYSRRNMHSKESGVEGADVTSLAGKQVVREEVCGLEDPESSRPAERIRRQSRSHGIRHPLDETQIRQVPSHAHQYCEPR